MHVCRCVPGDDDHRGWGHGVRCRGIHTDALLPAGAGAQSSGLLCAKTLDRTLSTLSSCSPIREIGHCTKRPSIAGRRIEGAMASSGMCLAAAPPVSAVGCAAGPARGVLKLRDQNIAAQRCRASLRQGTCALPTRKNVKTRRSEKLQSLQVAASAAGSLSSTPAAPSEPPFKWGADMKNLGISVGIATVMWFVPPPAGVALQAWHLLAIFLGTIVGIITQPLPLGAVAMLGLGATMLTKVLTFPAAFSAFASEIP